MPIAIKKPNPLLVVILRVVNLRHPKKFEDHGRGGVVLLLCLKNKIWCARMSYPMTVKRIQSNFQKYEI